MNYFRVYLYLLAECLIVMFLSGGLGGCDGFNDTKLRQSVIDEFKTADVAVAVSVRSLHDTGRSGFWFLITAVPVMGLIVFLYFMVLDSQPKANKYGFPQKAK